ncbi:glutamate receptor [Elysia marginata]|uniref:Glutamate receptor n=1 Tax=Elysia marginata TaxID=1093978 RepID=A0AAV4G7K0_9GAST|nr:glutamate receptor [Elysia marginata]
MVLPVFPKYIIGEEHLFDTTIGFHKEEVSAVFRKPHPDEDKWLTLIKPFRWQVHMMLFVAIVAYGLLTAVMERVNPFYMFRGSSLHSVIESIQYMFGALLNQGGSCLPSSMTGRVLVSFWWLFSIIIASTYGGNLIAFLTVSREILPFTDIHGLVKQNKYHWGFVNGTIPEELIQSNKLWQRLYSKVLAWRHNTPDIMSADVETHLTRVKNRHYAFIGPSSIVNAWVQNDCNLASFPVEGLCNTAAIGLVKGSPYKDLISDMLSVTQEAGLVDHWVSQRLLKTASFCEGSLIAEAQAINLMDVQSVFYASVIGIVLSSLLLAGELVIKRVSLWRQKAIVNKQKFSNRNVSSEDKSYTVRPRMTPWGWFCSTFNPFGRRSSGTHARQPGIPASRSPTWPKADTRSVWTYNTSFRRSVTDPTSYTSQEGKTLTREREDSLYKTSDLSKNPISVISYSRPNLRPATFRRRSSFTDLRYLRRARSDCDGKQHNARGNHPPNEMNKIFPDGWFNPCFCDSDTSLDDFEDRQSDDGGASCDSGLDRSSVASTKFGDLESELW